MENSSSEWSEWREAGHLYNHFSGKEALFASSISDGAVRLADAFTQIVSNHLDVPKDTRGTLIALAHDSLAVIDRYPEHFALVQVMTTEAAGRLQRSQRSQTAYGVLPQEAYYA